MDIADLVRQHRTALEAEVHLTLAQRRVPSAMTLCRTAALGQLLPQPIDVAAAWGALGRGTMRRRAGDATVRPGT